MAWFSGPALGHYIYFGLLNQDYAEMAAGAVLVAVLAIGADLVLGAVQRVLTPRALRSGVRRPEPPDVPGLPPPTGGGAFVRAVAE